MPRKDVELPPRMPEAATIAELQRALLDARAENARLRADAQAAVALVVERASPNDQAIQDLADYFWRVHPNEIGEQGYDHVSRGGKYDNPRAAWYADQIKALCRGAMTRALADADGLALVQALLAERDRFEAALGRACLVGGTTYLVERAEKAEADRDRLAAANAALEAKLARLVETVERAIKDTMLRLGKHPDIRRIMAPQVMWGAGDSCISAIRAALAEVQADARREGGE